MKCKKLGFVMLAVSVLAVVSGIVYMSYENLPVIHRGSASQFVEYDLEERIDRNHLIVVGDIVGIKTELFEETLWGTSYDSEKYVIETVKKPRHAITIHVTDVLKDDGILKGGDYVTVYDDEVDGPGKINDMAAQFHSQYATDYTIGDKGMFMINDDRGLNMMGFISYYPIKGEGDSFTREFDKVIGNPPLDIEKTKKIIRELADASKPDQLNIGKINPQ